MGKKVICGGDSDRGKHVMTYLIYTTETAAWNRSSKEAKARGMGSTTQYVSQPGFDKLLQH